MFYSLKRTSGLVVDRWEQKLYVVLHNIRLDHIKCDLTFVIKSSRVADLMCVMLLLSLWRIFYGSSARLISELNIYAQKWRCWGYLSSAEPAAAAYQTEPWWWCNSRRCPACGSYSASRDRLSRRPSPVWTRRRPLGVGEMTHEGVERVRLDGGTKVHCGGKRCALYPLWFRSLGWDRCLEGCPWTGAASLHPCGPVYQSTSCNRRREQVSPGLGQKSPHSLCPQCHVWSLI